MVGDEADAFPVGGLVEDTDLCMGGSAYTEK